MLWASVGPGMYGWASLQLSTIAKVIPSAQMYLTSATLMYIARKRQQLGTLRQLLLWQSKFDHRIWSAPLCTIAQAGLSGKFNSTQSTQQDQEMFAPTRVGAVTGPALVSITSPL
jgi:hypothetical protein